MPWPFQLEPEVEAYFKLQYQQEQRPARVLTLQQCAQKSIKVKPEGVDK